MMTGWKTEMKNCGIVPSYPFGVAPHFIWMKGMELPPCFVGHMDELKGVEFAPNLIFVIKQYFVGMNDGEASLVFDFEDRQGEYACNEWLECKVREMDNWNKMCKNCPYFERQLPQFWFAFFQIFPRVEKQDSYQLLTCRKLIIIDDHQKKFAPNNLIWKIIRSASF